ncbi:MAG: Phosphatidylserine decarboxylase proenzyme [Chlamydiia bacterium]|nr:Phosphatidylserine decarboxylase proenzyme [Chlamydiia bacterium]MCH9616265.1 Phosphatidylserine decarboxylase proenzyme [Chlamydiia bacterium]MCH9629749.1 Phosphatidylserine decarboxylase proenzyme [Chlamydiia bacterium]
MEKIEYIDRASREKKFEKVYGNFFLDLLYGNKWLAFALPLLTRFAFASKLYALFQKAPSSKPKIKKFIRSYSINASEFTTQNFHSFNDFFVRKLRSEVRPISPAKAVLPADGRYRVFKDVSEFQIKGKTFDVDTLLGEPCPYTPSLVLARLAPVDYHRFHFPCDCIPGKPRAINGPLYSVNPIAVAQNIAYLFENKRVVTPLESPDFGTVYFVEIGATYVGSIKQTYSPHRPVKKGDEKGYFEFGGSSIAIIFEQDKIDFATDLIDPLEIYGKMGQPLTEM